MNDVLQTLIEYYEEINHTIAIEVNKESSSKESPLISLDKFKEICKIAITIDALHKRGITSDNYKAKEKQYHTFVQKAFEEYGIEINEPYPFSNPTELYKIIDEILIDEGLTPKQRTIFFNETDLRNRIPKNKKRISLLSGIQELDNDNWLSDDFNEEWKNLSNEEQDEILRISPQERHQINESHEAKEDYYEKYNKDRYIKKLQLKKLKYTSNKS